MNDMEEKISLISEIEGIRIDKYLSEVTDFSRSMLSGILENKKCLVNDKAVNKSYKLKIGDRIDLFIEEPKEIEAVPENIRVEIIYEDSDVIVINKERGMVVHPANGNETGTLVNAVLYHCKSSLSGINGKIRPGIVHRIDKNTSGLLVIAKNDNSHIKLAAQLKEHSMTREYQALVHGRIKADGKVDAPIGRHRIHRKKMAVTMENSKKAVTHYEVIELFGNATHLKLRLETGRTHQIRVHMSYIGHPILGDDVYGNGEPKWLKGQCLHAYKLGFIHPTSDKYIEFEVPLPEYFKKALLRQ